MFTKYDFASNYNNGTAYEGIKVFKWEEKGVSPQELDKIATELDVNLSYSDKDNATLYVAINNIEQLPSHIYGVEQEVFIADGFHKSCVGKLQQCVYKIDEIYTGSNALLIAPLKNVTEELFWIQGTQMTYEQELLLLERLEAITTITGVSINMNSSGYQYVLFIIFGIIMILLVNIIFVKELLSYNKKIALLKLNGTNNRELFQQFFLRDLILISLSILGTYLIAVLCITNISEYLKNLYFVLIFTIVLYSLTYLLIFLFFMRESIVSAIKGNKIFGVLSSIYAVFIIIFLLVSNISIVFVANQFTIFMQERLTIQKYINNNKDKYVLEPKSRTNYIGNEERNNPEIHSEYLTFIDNLEDILELKFYTVSKDINDNNFMIVSIDANYIKNHFVDGAEITEALSGCAIFMNNEHPITMDRDSERNICRNPQKYYYNNGEHKEFAYTFDEDTDKIRVKEFRSPVYVYDDYLVGLNKKDIDAFSSLYNGGLQIYSKTEDAKALQARINTYLAGTKINTSFNKLVSLSEVAKNMTFMQLQQGLYGVAILVAILAIIMWMLRFIFTEYFKMHRKKIMIQVLNGHSIFKRYGVFLLSVGSLNIFVTIIAMYFLQTTILSIVFIMAIQIGIFKALYRTLDRMEMNFVYNNLKGGV